MLLLRQPSVEHARVVFERDAALILVLLKNSLQSLEHRRIFRIAGLWCVGGGKQAALEALVIKHLLISKSAGVKRSRRKKSLDFGETALVAHFFVVRPVGEEQVFVRGEKWCRVRLPFVPDQDDTSGRLEDTLELSTRLFQLEPVRGLAGGNEIQ